MRLNELAKMLKTAGEENRLRILCVVFNNENCCVSDIAKKLGLSVAVVSHHLQVMSRKGILTPVRDGKNICYRLPKDPFVKDLKKFICKHK